MTARLLAIMGSGEMAPTMIKPHRTLLERVGGGPAVFLDTPVGFQENRGEIADKAAEYFRQSVGTPIEVVRLDGADSFASAAALESVRRASYVFSGPGSPTYALAQWAGTPVPSMLEDKLRGGGCVTFASAAALTLGVVTVPVYEIYKVGAPAAWLDGLDLLSAARLRAAVIPHYNNAEGGTHDTRFCYLGERRLSTMETMLPAGAFVLGVDEHTGAVLDLDADTLEVVGVGVVTIRRGGRSVEHPAGSVVPLDEIRSGGGSVAENAPFLHQEVGGAPADSPSPLLARMDELEAAFADALAAGDVRTAAAAVLDAEDELHQWSQYTSDEVAKARLRLRAMVVRLGEAPAVGAFVDTLLEVRERARAARDFETSDLVRDRLVAAGVEVGDGRGGTSWRLLS